jgi:hypothetical protein
MKHTVIIDDKTKTGKSLVGLLKTLPATTVNFVDNDDLSDCISVEEWSKELKKSIENAFEKN